LIGLVGKGIVFETSGLQIKPKPTMPGIKQDMGVGGVFIFDQPPFQTAVKQPVHANIRCLAENAVANHALEDYSQKVDVALQKMILSTRFGIYLY
jgi:leucyl aminopeptidase